MDLLKTFEEYIEHLDIWNRGDCLVESADENRPTLPGVYRSELTLYNIEGCKPVTLAEGTYQPGEYSAKVSGLSIGVYIYGLIADENEEIEVVEGGK